MKKKIFLVSLIVIVLISGLFILTGCGKKPETTSIFIATKDGIKSSELDSLKYVSTKEKINQVKKNTMTDKKTGKTII